MNLAAPAPQVEKAEAKPAPRESSGRSAVIPSTPAEAPLVVPAPRVDPAKVYSDPWDLAPANVRAAAEAKPAPEFWSVEALRAGQTLDFQGYAAVIQGAPSKNFFKKLLPWIFDERDFVAYGESKQFVVVVGQTCFVYAEETSLKPFYAIDLTQYIAIQEDRDHPDPQSFTVSPEPDTNKPRPTMITILLKRKMDRSQAFQFTFETADDRTLAKRFLDVVTRQSKEDRQVEVAEGIIVDEKDKGDRNDKKD